MTKLLDFIRPADGIARAIDPEDLISMAEAIGKLEVDHELGSSAYRSRIRFENKSGSLIWATGIDTHFFTAISKSIQEAERLK